MLLYFLLPILCNALLLAACKLPKLAPAGSEFSKTAVRMGILPEKFWCFCFCML